MEKEAFVIIQIYIGAEIIGWVLTRGGQFANVKLERTL